MIQEAEQKNDLIVCTLKLFAVREKDKKLIGVVNFIVNWQSDQDILLDRKVIAFQKCIDPNANITISARIFNSNNMT